MVPNDLVLSVKQRNIFLNLSAVLKKELTARLDYEEPQSLRIVKLTLRILAAGKVKQCFSDTQSFLTPLLKKDGSELETNLEKAEKIWKLGYGKEFLSFSASNRKYDKLTKTLPHAIKMFSNLIENHHEVSKLLPYDQGGKEFAAQLLDSSTMLMDKPFGQSMPQTPDGRTDLLNINGNFPKVRSKAMQYLESLDLDRRLSIDLYKKLMKCLKNDTLLPLKNYQKVELTKLIILTTTFQQKSFLKSCTLKDLLAFIDSFCQVAHAGFDDIMSPLLHALDGCNNLKLNELGYVFSILSSHAENPQIQKSAVLFAQSEIGIEEFFHQLESHAVGGVILENSQMGIEDLKNRFQGDDKNVEFSLDQETVNKLFDCYITISQQCDEWKELKSTELIQKANNIREKESYTFAEILQLIAIARLAIFHDFKIYPYPVQVMALLGILEGNKGRIAQVKTGEGKSTIVTMLAFVLSMQKKSVDVVSSSQYLAKRDFYKYSDFFKKYGITSSHICEYDQTPEMFDGQLLFGTASDFEFAIMREKLFRQPLIKTREKGGYKEKCVIVDEVDNLTIDTIQSSARLAYPSKTSYEWVYLPIFQFVKDNLEEDFTIPGDANKIVAEQLIPFIKGFMGGRYSQAVDQLSIDQLKSWMTVAHKALWKFQKDENYIIAKKRLPSGEIERAVLIVDAENTGKIMESSRWGSGLHEFVELKHNIEIKKESLVPIALSHAVYYENYDKIYGLTGTLGSESERDEIRKIYGIDSFDVPTHRPSRRIDGMPELYSDDNEYLKRIVKSIKHMQQEGRPCLVLCESIKNSTEIVDLCRENGLTCQVYNDQQDESEDDIIAKAGQPGAVTIATNTAGRGTDIKLTDESIQNGGLHVILTFYPASQRIEDQAIGRAGRQGQPGSSNMFLSKGRLQADLKHIHETVPMFYYILHQAALDLPKFTFDMDLASITMQHFDGYRTIMSQIGKEKNCKTAEIERYTAQLTNRFYDVYEQFMKMTENQAFIKECAQFLCNQRLLKVKMDIDSLPIESEPLAQAVARCLRSRLPVASEQWENILDQITAKVQNDVIVMWSEEFFHNKEKLVQQKADQISIDEMKEELSSLFEQSKLSWRKYMNPPWRGFARTLDDMMKVDFSKHFESIYNRINSSN